MIWESLLILAGKSAAIVLLGVEKRLIWEKKLQENVEKSPRQQEKTVQGTGKFVWEIF